MRASRWVATTLASSSPASPSNALSTSSSGSSSIGIGVQRIIPQPPAQPIMVSVEWGTVHKTKGSIARILPQLQPAATHFVLPDLPHLYSDDDRQEFWQATTTGSSRPQRIQTIAVCYHDSHESLLKTVKQSSIEHPNTTFLLVGGNEKDKQSSLMSSSSLSTVQAANMLRNELGGPDVVSLWGVANPNDPSSIESTGEKIEAGITGIITQPLLSSTAKDTLQLYNSQCRSSSSNDGITILAGLAFPTTAKSLQFWATKLLRQGDELRTDPLFQSHLAYFSQPYYTTTVWIGRECQELLSYMDIETVAAAEAAVDLSHQSTQSKTRSSIIHGIHCMPLHNMDDLCTLLQSLNRMHLQINKNQQQEV